MKKKTKIWLISCSVIVVLGALLGQGLEFFKADIFTTTNEAVIISESKEVYIPSNYKVSQGENGSIEIIANQDFNNVVGFSFELEWNGENLSTQGFNLTGTPFENQSFMTDANTADSGIIKAISATGQSGVNISKGESFAQVSLQVSPTVSLGKEIPITINSFSIVTEENGVLLEDVLLAESGKLTLDISGDLKVVDINNLSSNSLEIEFSDFLKEAVIGDLTFTPELKNTNTTLRIVDKKILIENLDPEIAYQEYRIDIAHSVDGNSSGNLSEDHDFVYFTGYPSNEALSDFYITKIIAVDDTHFDVYFSEDVNPLSIEKADFSLYGLNILEVKMGTESNVLQVETSSQGIFTGSGECSTEIQVSSQPDLKIKKNAPNTVANVNDNIFFTIDFENAGNAMANGAVIIDVLPGNMDFGISTDCSFDNTSREILCNLGDISGKTGGTISYSATINSLGSNTSIAIIGSSSGDSNLENNFSSETIIATASNYADLSVDSSFDSNVLHIDFKNSGNVSSVNNLLSVELKNSGILAINPSYACDSDGANCFCVIDSDNELMTCDIPSLDSEAIGTLDVNLDENSYGNLEIATDFESGSTDDFNLLNNTKNISVEILQQNETNIILNKNSNQTVLSSGTDISISLQYINQGDVRVDNISIIDEVPSNFNYVISSLNKNTCLYNSISREIQCSDLGLAPSEEALISYKMTAISSGDSTAGAVLIADTFTASSDIGLSVDGVSQDLYLVSNFSENKNGDIEVRIDYENTGNVQATGVQIVSTLSTEGALEIQDNSSCTVNSNRTQITCNLNNLNGGDSGYINYIAHPITQGVVNISSLISSDGADYNQANNSYNKIINVDKVGENVLSVSADKTVVSIGDTINFTISFQNASDIASYNVNLLSKFGAEGVLGNFAIIDRGAGSCVVNPSSISCFAGDLDSSESGSIQFSAEAIGEGTFYNDTEISNGGSDHVFITVSGNALADVSVQKTVDKYLVNTNDKITNTINYANTGNADASDIIIMDNLEYSGNIVISEGYDLCAVANNIIACNLPLLSAGESGKIVYSSEITNISGGKISGSTSIETSTNESNSKNNTDNIFLNISNLLCSIYSSEAKIANGDSAILNWSTNASNATINQNIGEVSLDGDLVVSPQTNKSYTMTTGYLGDSLLSISNGLKSVNENSLSLSIFPFTAYNADTIVENAPQIDSAKAIDGDIVEISFKNNVFESSATEGTCYTANGNINGVCNIYSIYALDAQGNITGNNLIDENVDVKISNDYLTVTLYNIPTSETTSYLLSIKKDTIKDYDTDTAIGDFYNTAVFLGQKSFFESSKFEITGISNQTPEGFMINFSEEPSVSYMNPTYFSILSYENGERKELTVSSVEKNGNSVQVNTYLQSPDSLYFLIINPEIFSSINDVLIGTKNTQGLFGFSTGIVNISSVEPSNITNDQDNTVIITGENFEEDFKVELGGVEIDSTFVSNTEISALVPSGKEIGLYDLSLVKNNGDATKKENAIIVSEPECSITVLSDESYASPYRVSNQDGKTTLWVRVEDCMGVSDIEKITADLRPIAGDPASLFSTDEEAIITDDKRWFSLDIDIPQEATTSEEPVQIEIIAENKSGIKDYGSVELMITRDTFQSVPPVVNSAYSYPTQVAPGDNTPISFYVEVEDVDGADDISKAVLDLGSIGLGTEVMNLVSSEPSTPAEVGTLEACVEDDYIAGEWAECTPDGTRTRSIELKAGVSCDTSDETNRPLDEEECEYTAPVSLLDLFIPKALADNASGNIAWFEKEDLYIPSSVLPGNYIIPVIVIDKEGEETRTEINFSVQQNTTGTPFIDEDDVYTTPPSTTKNDGETTFSIHVKATDPNGADDIESVTANLMSIGIEPITLTKGAIEGNGAWFSSEELTIGRTINPGYRTLEFTVTDKAGNYFTNDDYEFYVSDETIAGNPPIVDASRFYTSPRTVSNDGETKVNFYIFVEEGSADIDNVSINLENIARYVGDNQESFFNNGEEESATQNTIVSDRIVRFLPSLKEGGKGQWYILPDVVIESTTLPSLDPYLLNFVVSDTNGNTTEGEVSLYVSDETGLYSQNILPYVKSVVATSNREVDILFSEGIDTKLIDETAFEISEYSNSSIILPIKEIETSADGRIVHLTTNFMNEDTMYTLKTDMEQLGLNSDQLNSNKINFSSFKDEEFARTPKIKNVKAKGANEIEINFTQTIKFTSVNENGSNFSIFQQGGGEALEIKSVSINNDGGTIRLEVSDQEPRADYYLLQSGLTNVQGEEVVTKTKMFTGYVASSSSELIGQADFNKDGGVDFSDFTIFASVYGKDVENETESMDLDGNGKIDFTDFTIFAENFGKNLGENPDGDTEDGETEFSPLDNPEDSPTNTPVFDAE